MANYRALWSTCEAVMRLLKQQWQPARFNNNAGLFQVFQTDDFETKPISVGVSLYVYRVVISSVQRTSPPRPRDDGLVNRRQLPVEVYFLLTPWATSASMQLEILGWMMRTLEDYPIVPPGLLNTPVDGVFKPDEYVELVAWQLTNEEVFRIWDVIPGDYRLSAPYMARTVRIESEITTAEGGPVITRDLEYGVLKQP
jgi:hypothetical protein